MNEDEIVRKTLYETSTFIKHVPRDIIPAKITDEDLDAVIEKSLGPDWKKRYEKARLAVRKENKYKRQSNAYQERRKPT